MSLSGLFNVYKPVGLSSRAVVDRAAVAVRPAKAGHAGTLDPLASGVLVVCVGTATRLIDYVQRMHKRYTGTFLLGQSSPSDDVETDVTHLSDAPRPSREAVVAAAARFVGEIQQRPPAFSALKVAGRRAYKIARQGKPVALEPRPITVYRLEVVRYAYPELTLDIECGSGTYVRALGRDLAEWLSTAAVMSALERTAIGDFRAADACPFDELTRATRERWLLPAERALVDLPRVTLSDDQVALVKHGRTIPRDSVRIEGAAEAADATEFAAFDATGTLTAVLVRRPNGGLGPKHNL